MSRPAALVVAPHADDESIGCGGTLVALAERGFDVEVLLVTRPEPVGRRREEHAAALRTLGARSGPGLELPQQRIVADEAAVAGVLAVLRRLRPALVLAPHRLELDRDHRETHRIVTAALQADRWTADVEPPLLWEYEVWTALAYPHLLVDISERVRHKRSAIGCYSSQLVEHDYVAAALGLNAYRGVMLGPGRGYCEAFAQATPPNPRHRGLLEGLCTYLA